LKKNNNRGLLNLIKELSILGGLQVGKINYKYTTYNKNNREFKNLKHNPYGKNSFKK